MSMQDNAPQNTPTPVQFDKADFDQPSAAAVSCVFCKKPVGESYYEINGQITCNACRQECEKAISGGSGSARFFKALFLGLVAAIVGAAIWYAVTVLTGYELGLIAIVVGLLVGFAVRKGSEGRGGWVYQLLAILLTYSAIVSTYVPPMLKSIDEENAKQASLAASVQGGNSASQEIAPEAKAVKFFLKVAILFAFSFALPFLAGFENAIGLLIIGFALYEAWQINKRTRIQITGPYQLSFSGHHPIQMPPAAT
jgi:hypothetical protein